jgi:hypothetical protein
MGLMNVAQMQNGHSRKLGDQHGVSRESPFAEPMRQQDPMAALSQARQRLGPSMAMPMDGQVRELDTMTLCFYGILFADLLLLYIALKVS